MIEILLVALKFVALIIGGIFAALGLLTDYRDKKGVVTKWGRIALFGIVLSTILAAGTQAIESYRDRAASFANDAANRKSEERTQNLLGQIRRAIYPIRNVIIRELSIGYPADSSFIATYLKSLNLRSSSEPEDAPWSEDVKLVRGSPSYPVKGYLLDLIEPEITVSCWRNGADIKGHPDLQFYLKVTQTSAYLSGNHLFVTAYDSAVPDDRLSLSQGTGSLEDLRNGQIRMKIFLGATKDQKLRQDMREASRKTIVVLFRLLIANHQVMIQLEPAQDEKFSFVGTIPSDDGPIW